MCAVCRTVSGESFPFACHGFGWDPFLTEPAPSPCDSAVASPAPERTWRVVTRKLRLTGSGGGKPPSRSPLDQWAAIRAAASRWKTRRHQQLSAVSHTWHLITAGAGRVELTPWCCEDMTHNTHILPISPGTSHLLPSSPKHHLNKWHNLFPIGADLPCPSTHSSTANSRWEPVWFRWTKTHSLCYSDGLKHTACVIQMD